HDRRCTPARTTGGEHARRGPAADRPRAAPPAGDRDERTGLMDQVSQAIAEIAAGRMVIVTDAPGGEDEGDCVADADAVTPDTVAFMATHGRGLVCAPITA